jgi:hypothetical protein
MERAAVAEDMTVVAMEELEVMALLEAILVDTAVETVTEVAAVVEAEVEAVEATVVVEVEEEDSVVEVTNYLEILPLVHF